MAASFPLDRSTLDKWRDHLQDINFWRKGYLNSDAYYSLRKKLVAYKHVHVQWNVGVGPTACFTQAISSIIREEKMRLDGPFDHVIEVDMEQASWSWTSLNIYDRLAFKVAEQLGLLALNQEYNRLKEEDDELRYYTYGIEHGTDALRDLSRSLASQINQKLLGKRYILAVQNLNWPIKIDALTQMVGLPPATWGPSFWLVSTTSEFVYDQSSSSDHECVVQSLSGDDILMLTLYSLHQAAKHIYDVIGDKDEQQWHLVALWCFHYAAMLLVPFSDDITDSIFNSEVVPALPSDNNEIAISSSSLYDEDVPSSLTGLELFLRVANRVEGINPRIAYLCRLYAFDKARRLDPRSTGRGVHQFKTVLRQRLEKENEATLKHRIKQSDYSELTLFWQKYVEKSKQAIQHCGALVEDLSRLNKEYETTTVLSEVLSRFRQQPSGGKLRKDDIISHKHDLICQWAAQGILPTINRSVQETTFEVTNSYHRKIKFNEDNVYQVGNAILEAFLEYSLLQLPFPYEAKADDPTKSAAHFLAYQGLIAEQLTIGEIWVDQHSRLEHMQWISHMDDQGWQISREWLSHGHRPRGPTTLVVRRCSPSFFAKLGQLLPKLPYLHVLDLSYTQVESLPPSICYLQKLQLLLLKGCHKLANPFSFPITLPGKNITNKVNLLNLDLSYSNVETFDSDFFQNMPSLQELLLVGCSDLVELPPSIVGLSSLTTLKITRTRIKSFHYWEIFNKMKKLLSLELINGIGGWEFGTEEELKLEGHPTLRSFSLVAAPYIRRLSFNGCRKLESVDTLEELDALEELDLSATGIKELPAHIPNLPRLRQLLLIGVPALRRFPWHALKRLPDIVCLDRAWREMEFIAVHKLLRW